MTNKEITAILRRQAAWFIVAGLIISALTLALSYKLGNTSFEGQVLTSFGGSILGACLGIVISGILDASPLNRIEKFVENTLESSIYSDTKAIIQYRKIWHHYILTEISETSGKKQVWRYRKIDFSHLPVRGKLIATINVPMPKNERNGKTVYNKSYIRYRIEAFICQQRLIFIQRNQDWLEPDVVQIFPSVGDGYRDVYAGICTLHSWSGRSLLTPVLMSDEPLIGEIPEGTVSDADYEALTSIWTQSFSNGCAITDPVNRLASGFNLHK